MKRLNEGNFVLFTKSLFFAAAAVFVFSCTSIKFDSKALDAAFKEGNYEQCIKITKGRNYGKENRVLKNMDIAVLTHYAKNYKSSSQYFNESDRLMDQGDLQSTAQFESFYLNILNSLNYYHLGKIEEAAAEIKKADDEKVRTGRENKNSLWHIVNESGNVDLIRGFDEDEAPSKELKDAIAKFGLKPAELNEGSPRKPLMSDLYKGSPTAYYLGGLFRNANGDSEGARLNSDYLKVLNPKISLAETLKESSDKANLNIIAFSGVIAEKKEVIHYFPKEGFLKGITIPISGKPFKLPAMRFKFAYTQAGDNTTVIDSIEAEITNIANGAVEKHFLTLLEDFGEDLKKNVALKARKEYQKTKAASVIGKLGAAITSATAVFTARTAFEKQKNNPLLAGIAQKALNTAEAALPAALENIDKGISTDTRQVKFLPAKSSVANVKLAEGIYNIKIRYLKGGALLHEDSFLNIEVKNKKLNLLESICLK